MRTLPFAVFTLAAVALLSPTGARAADEVKHGFLDRTHKDRDGAESKYVLFVPHDYKGDKPAPLILFLHGSGESGTDPQKPVKQGIGNAIKKQEKTFPFITIFALSQKRTWKADSDDIKRALAILDEVQKEYQVDPKRVYLTGLSMGGSGTWGLAAAQPERWAAIVPVCGGGDPSTVEKFKDIPCWCFCGDADQLRTVESNRKMVEALKKAGATPKYTEYPKVGHNCWDKAYGTPELYEWLLKQEKK